MKCVMQERGFTLLEVLIALLVVAVTLSAATAAVGGAARRQAGLEERTFATWAAQNTLSRLRLDDFAGDATQSEQSIAGQTWRVDVKARAEGPLRRVDLTVRRAGEAEAQPLARLTGFLPTPVQDAGPDKQPAPTLSPDSPSDPQAQDRSMPRTESPPELAP
jgi:general secretion pathway protein I